MKSRSRANGRTTPVPDARHTAATYAASCAVSSISLPAGSAPTAPVTERPARGARPLGERPTRETCSLCQSVTGWPVGREVRMEVPRPLLVARQRIDNVARHSPAQLTLTAFAGIVTVFTALLSSPQATADGHQAPFADAFFTATSAVCITGLTTVPTGTYWSGFGQAVILVGIWIGGLGIMTLASLLGMAVSRRIGLTQRLLGASEARSEGLGEVGSLIRVVVITSVSIELVIALALIPRFAMLGEDLGEAIWHGVFYAVSAFNNAGFVPTAEGLMPHAADWLSLIHI